MPSIIIEGRTADGETIKQEVEKDERRISFDIEQLVSIDLTPLARCLSLQELILRRTWLTSLDLTPLAECKELLTLDFGLNQFTSLNLTPLKGCKKLQKICLRWNKLLRLA